jgi:hypothetical protein
VTKTVDAEGAIRKVSALRALCLSLPSVPTPAERARLRRFAELVDAPASATSADVDALAAGWRRWWREGERERLRAMVANVPAALLEADRRLATYACAARAGETGPA